MVKKKKHSGHLAIVSSHPDSSPGSSNILLFSGWLGMFLLKQWTASVPYFYLNLKLVISTTMRSLKVMCLYLQIEIKGVFEWDVILCPHLLHIPVQLFTEGFFLFQQLLIFYDDTGNLTLQLREIQATGQLWKNLCFNF